MLPHTSTTSHKPPRRIPLDIRNAIMVRRPHNLQIRRQIPLLLIPLTFKIEVPELQIKRLLIQHRRHDHKPPIRTPVDSIIVLLIHGPDQFEIADRIALALLRAEERHGGLGRHGRASGHFAGGDEDEAVPARLPGEVYHGVVDVVDDFDGDAFFADAEDFEVCGEGFFALAVAVDFDADEGGFALPVQFGVRDVEEVPCSDDFFAGDAHEADFGGIASHFGGPVAEELLVFFSVVALWCSRRPFEVHHPFHFDALLIHQIHPREFVDADALALCHARHVLGICAPLECRPLDLLLDRVALWICGRARKV